MVMVQKHGPNKNGDGWIPERIFISMPKSFFERREGRTEGVSTWMTQRSNLRTRADGMVAGNKSSAANSNNGLPRNERAREKGREGEKRASFRLPPSLPPPLSLSSIISRRHLTILKIPERLHISHNRTLEARHFLPRADLVHAFTTLR